MLAATASAQQISSGFDEELAEEDLLSIELQLRGTDLDEDFLTNAGTRVVRIEAVAASCASAAMSAVSRLEERYAPLEEVDSETSTGEFMRQRNEIRSALDDAIADQSRCEGIEDHAKRLQDKISKRQTALSQQFLSNRSMSVLALIREFPRRAATWPEKIRGTISLRLVNGISAVDVLLLLIAAGAFAALLGLSLRQSFKNWYGRGGGDDADAQLKYLLPKPAAEFAPLWLIGIAFILVLTTTLQDASVDVLVVRVAWAILIFGIANVVINWATGPLSPSAAVTGLIPDHVRPLRLRLRMLFLVICTSFVVLGANWLSVRVSVPYVSGRASMIFLVAIAFLVLFIYLPRIPGIHGRFRLLRFFATATTALSVLALLAGYQNLAAFLIHGVTRTGLALFILWMLLWFVYVSFDYLIKQETPTAIQVRKTLGISKAGSGTGIGFMRLVADLVLWIGFAVYMLYVWDDAGTTLSHLYANIVGGWKVGDFRIVPLDYLRGILYFVAVIIVIGWMKRWIDRRWLQQLAIERGARDAIVTLFGYVGFVIAVLVALSIANINLTGLTYVSTALALGLGFGMQEIANNFVSGLILLFERPIRAGDFVSVGEIEGFVRSIRIRATEIETLDNQNVLVPNSELVSGRVTNWVLRDTHGRLQVQVGVAYGSDVEKVRDILESVARENSEVITDGRAPAPRALFMGFGDSSLDFELRVRIQRIERRFSVTSDLNFEIEKAFRDAGIAIPFPQRDLHIVSHPETEAPTPTTARKKDKHSFEPQSTIVERVTRSHRAELLTTADTDAVWNALTDVDSLARWLIREGDFNAHVGGIFTLVLHDGFEMSGRIDIFMPTRRMRVVVAPQAEEGPLPTGPITVEFQLRRKDEKTRLTVVVAGIPDSEDWEAYYQLSVDRWENALAELESKLLDA